MPEARRPELDVDAVIVGGGIAGLWMLARLREAGYSAALIEAGRLGQGQTIASQGIIHGGVKYALGGIAGDDSAAIAAMPGRWRLALAGREHVDLRGARLLSGSTMMWTRAGVASKLMGAAASRVLRAAPRRIEPADAQPGLRDAPDSVSIYAVDEPVLDVASVLERLLELSGGAAVAARGADDVELAPGAKPAVRVASLNLTLRAPLVVLAAGAGNEGLLGSVRSRIVMQRRPLHMVMARGRLPELHGHCIGAHPKPLATITTARDAANRTVWWIGGRIAEEGAGRDRDAVIAAAKEDLAACLPWINLDEVQWSAWAVDRAEAKISGGAKPEGPMMLDAGGGVYACWPTKLAFAPEVGDRMLELAEAVCGEGAGHEAAETAGRVLKETATPLIARYPWDEESARWT